jgi:ankyrin repeat protein
MWGNIGTADILLSKGALINDRDSSNHSSLDLAITNSREPMWQLLVERGASTDAPDGFLRH